MAFARITLSSSELSTAETEALQQAHRTRRPVRHRGVCYWVRQKQTSYDTEAGRLEHLFTLQGAPEKDCG